MKHLTNIEPSAFRKGEYIGYRHGVWIVRRSSSSYGRWQARHRDNQRAPTLYVWTLEELPQKLEAVAAD